MAMVLPQFAPGVERPQRLPAQQRNRPDEARRQRIALVAVFHAQLSPFLARFSDDAVLVAKGLILSHEGRDIGGSVGPFQRGVVQNGADPGLRAGASDGLVIIRGRGGDAQARKKGLHFVGFKHDRGQVVGRVKHIADPRLAIDGRAGRLQRRDIAVDRARRHLKLGSQTVGADRQTAAAQVFDQPEQAFGASYQLAFPFVVTTITPPAPYGRPGDVRS